MAGDPNPKISADMIAQRVILAPQIRGMNDLAATSISTPLRDAIQAIQRQRMHRDELIVAALAARDNYIAALTTLEKDGYPDLPNVPVRSDLLSELDGQNDDLHAASVVFVPEPAANISIGLSEPMDKP